MMARQRLLTFFMVLVSVAYSVANAGTIDVNIHLTDSNGQPLENGVIWAVSQSSETPQTMPEKVYVMGQKNKLFQPFVLPVNVGGKVSFPNSDSIKHHVYSFSSAKRFELKLYRDSTHEPIVFDKPGVVEMGCNIHDWMLSYIVIVDSPNFATTGVNGDLILTLAQGKYTLFAWHPRFKNKDQPIPLDIDTAQESEISIQILQQLLPEVKQQMPNNARTNYDRY